MTDNLRQEKHGRDRKNHQRHHFISRSRDLSRSPFETRQIRMEPRAKYHEDFQIEIDAAVDTKLRGN